MATERRSNDEPETTGQRGNEDRLRLLEAGAALGADQGAADEEQSLADVDQTLADDDQTAAASDAVGAVRDQLASDRDQAIADQVHDHEVQPAAAEDAYEAGRDARRTTSVERLGNSLRRTTTAADRDLTSAQRDRIADARDKAGRDRDARAAATAEASTDPTASLEDQLEQVRAQAAADRARAAADRERASLDRANAARDRARLEAELRSAHLDELTGVYRREMGRLALSNEIARARRSDGRFVVAFVDVDRLKVVNDRDGHAAGDRALQTVVREIRSRLRSFDPIIRYGGDEFVCGISGTDIEETARRFEAIGIAIEADSSIGISVGLAALEADETPDELTERADVAMLQVKAAHRLAG